MQEVINAFVNNLPFEVHLTDPIHGKYAACGPGTKHSERIQNFLDTKDVNHIYKNELDKACFQHDKGYHKYKDVDGRIPYDKKLIKDTAKISQDQSLDGYQRSYAALINKFFSKKIGSGLNRREINKLKKIYYDPTQGFSSAAELSRRTGFSASDITKWLETQDTYTRHKAIKRKFPTRRVMTGGINHQWQSDLIEMQSFAKENNNFKYILTVIDVFSKYAWAIPLKNKSASEVHKAFSKLFASEKPLKLQTDKGLEFTNKPAQELFKKLNIGWFATENLAKAQVVERFNRTLQGRMYKYFTANNTKKWVNVLDDLMKNYNTSYHRSIKMRPTEAHQAANEGEVRNNLYGTTVTIKKPKFKVGDTVRISKYHHTFSRGYSPNFSSEKFTITKVENTNPVTYRIRDADQEEIIGSFYQEELALVR